MKLSNLDQQSKVAEIKTYYLVETVKLSLFTAPMYCFSTNMQFISSELAKRGSFMESSHFYRKYFTKNLPSTNVIRPFKHSYFSNYREVLSALYKQGFSSFYKGNFTRISYFTLTNLLKSYMDNFVGAGQIPVILKDITLFSIVDIALNPLLYAESRLTVQNSKKGFRTYSSLAALLTKDARFLYSGAILNIPRNILFVAGLNTPRLTDKISREAAILIAHLLAYPILTAHRTVMLHGYNNMNFPRPAFRGSFGCLSHIFKEHGIIPFYRGFGPFLAATFLWHFIVPRQARYKYMRNMLEDEEIEQLKIKELPQMNETEDEDI